MFLAPFARESARKFFVLGIRSMLKTEKPAFRRLNETSSKVNAGQSVGFVIM